MKEVDSYSYQCGAIDSLNEMVAAGVKALAFPFPAHSREERDALLAYAEESCRRYETHCCPEDDPLLTDLFPLSYLKGTFLILFYRAEHVIHEYTRLKARKTDMMQSGAYFGGNRIRLALEVGRLLSYPEELARQLLEQNEEKEVVPGPRAGAVE